MEEIGLEEIGEDEGGEGSVDRGQSSVATLTERDDAWHDEGCDHAKEHDEDRHVARFLARMRLEDEQEQNLRGRWSTWGRLCRRGGNSGCTSTPSRIGSRGLAQSRRGTYDHQQHLLVSFNLPLPFDTSKEYKY